MFLETVDQFATVATARAAFLRRSPVGFWISSMMAGAYVGLGIILIFCGGANVDPSNRPVVMGASFGIALTLVIFAGSDLFTGHTMFMTLGWLQQRTSLRDLAACWGASWAGNLAGCVFLAAIFVAGGGGLACRVALRLGQLDLEPDGCFVAEVASQPVGTHRMGAPIGVDREPGHRWDEPPVERVGKDRGRKDFRQRLVEAGERLAVTLGAKLGHLHGESSRGAGQDAMKA